MQSFVTWQIATTFCWKAWINTRLRITPWTRKDSTTGRIAYRLTVHQPITLGTVERAVDHQPSSLKSSILKSSTICRSCATSQIVFRQCPLQEWCRKTDVSSPSIISSNFMKNSSMMAMWWPRYLSSLWKVTKELMVQRLTKIWFRAITETNT